jgi:methyl-accepting chemotaxis protein
MTLLKNQKMYTKMMAGFGIIVAVLFIFGTYLVFQMLALKNEVTRFKQVTARKYMLSDDIKFDVSQIWQFITDSSATGEDDGIKEAEGWAEKCRKSISEYASVSGSDEKGEDAGKRLAALNDFFETGRKMAAAYKVSRENGNQVMKEFDGKADKIITMVNDLADKHRQELNTGMDDMVKIISGYQTLTIMVMILALVFSITVSAILAKSISRPILDVVSFAEKMSGGDLRHRFDSDRNDEIGILGKALNSMTENLRDIMRRIVEAGSSMGGFSDKLSGLSSGLNRHADELKHQTSTVAASSHQTLASVQSISR